MEAAAGGDIVVAKGKRSKRQRAHAAAAPEVVTTPAADDSAGAAESSSLSSVVVAEEEEEAASGCVTEEEEDMAMCLMLLARGGHGGSTSAAMATEGNKKFRSRRREEGSGELVYECRTCSKRFPSFQALGGHRTSHKKARLPTPKADSEDLKKAPSMSPPPPSPTDPAALLAIPAPATPPPPAAMNPNPKQQRRDSTAMATGGSSRVHECSICGAEFASGQALGGHMRRHRPLVPAAAAASEGEEPTTAVRTKEKSLLELNLNMPPSDDDVHGTTKPAAFVFNVNDLLFPAPTSAPASAMVVDCHY